MTTPFQKLHSACVQYAELLDTFNSLQSALLGVSPIEGGEEVDSDDLPPFKQARITFVDQLDALISIDVPITKKILKIAITEVSAKLAPVVDLIRDTAAEAAIKIAEAQCQKSPSSTTTPTTASASRSAQP